ncbi:hypothetical protein C2S52_018717 [Perilla frutescens var. hirtella]|nr:hypothetical protein C2S52_018717 [Perilla frutescens var. hirtella]
MWHHLLPHPHQRVGVSILTGPLNKHLALIECGRPREFYVITSSNCIIYLMLHQFWNNTYSEGRGEMRNREGIGTQRSVHEVAESVLEAIHAGVNLTNPDLLVYMRQGEACWHYLKDLFVEVIELSDTTGQAAGQGGDSVQVREFPRALFDSSDSTSYSHHQSSESRYESGVINQSSYSLGSLTTLGFPNPSDSSDSV